MVTDYAWSVKAYQTKGSNRWGRKQWIRVYEGSRKLVVFDFTLFGKEYD